MRQRVGKVGLWISTILILIVMAVQGWSGGWSAFYLVWPGYNPGNTFLLFVARLALYHMRMGFFTIGALSVLIIIFAFLARSSIYVRIFAIVGLLLVALAAYGGLRFVTSSLQDRLSLGQMADSFIGVFAAYFLQFFFMNKTPVFPWDHARAVKE